MNYVMGLSPMSITQLIIFKSVKTLYLAQVLSIVLRINVQVFQNL